MRGWVLSGLVFLFAFAVPNANATDGTRAEVEKLLNTIPDVRTENVTYDFRSAAPKAWVVVFVGTQCRVVRDYLPRLQKWAAEWAENRVQVVFAFSHQHETQEQVRSFAKEKNISFLALHDEGSKLALALRAERSPEAFVLSEDYRVQYRGRVDDQFQFTATLPAPKNNYLKDSVAAVLAGKYPSPPVTDVEGCFLNLPIPHRDLTFTEDIGPLVFNKCTTCHQAGEVAGELFKFVDYDSVANNADTIQYVTEEKIMPPWKAGPGGNYKNNFGIDANDIWAIRSWIKTGKQKGPGEISPPKPADKAGFKNGVPDAIVPMTAEDAPEEIKYFRVPPKEETPVLPYKYFRVKTNFPEDRWITAAEIKNLAPEVVHHTTVFLVPKNIDDEWVLNLGPMGRLAALKLAKSRYNVSPENFEWTFKLYGRGMRRPVQIVATFNPGEPTLRYADGFGFLLPKGAELIFECHYTPTETERKERSMVGLWFSPLPKNPLDKTIITRMGAYMDEIQIPPRETLTLTRRLHFHAPVYLTSLRPHMHQRGKTFTATIEYPDGKKEMILHIPAFDYAWQVRYEFEKPFVIPKGGVLHLTYFWDNTERPGNPDPGQHIKFGLQFTDEMAVSYPTYVYVNPADREEAEAKLHQDLVDRP